MHYYTLDTEIRKKVYIIITLISLSFPTLFENFRGFFGIPSHFGFPISFGAIFSLLFFIQDKFVWKLFGKIIPNLNGTWNASGISSYKDPTTGENFKFQMEVIIRQTFSKIEVHTETEDSTSRSTMASICSQHAMPIFRYSFENTPKNKADDELQRHPGLIELRIKNKKLLQGDYFSGKHRLGYGELTYKRSLK